MAESECYHCGGCYHWHWEEAFDKYGYADGDGQIETPYVQEVLTYYGYQVQSEEWGMHNIVIISVKKDGIEQIPQSAKKGFDNARDYLPSVIVNLLDEHLPSQTPYVT